ncbi:MAG: hypothetical protein A2509_09765 [Candidatus Edwardsbacteria bacterium RIFOXYD12_FULL_50_11]|uniref:Uncharacterized protein n=1 Tax=Candidatus Edwardsbacteria bacterium GWF2_54_11 TaxID=1817851 RepID=A0A1F5RC05_9BACT|nr:MAG: hypothetical protein A2502_08105 [Candidatus Edwardsbacteria bacterium RifOxyC12_full_54_24]OGF07444.1 MAG: hypothetical protein A2273_02950 [Candidatus Edwardsbacteria bacterium RifOxyA12_full_54_48]OGF09694.1 MAG: hypothetical protein A3K15_09360 [Candidatus Edwardsbacteria bacterium GWE2_54_12]OGF11957.1 MAG: hypothetical protein A2024_02915 [Candidatus Edwardsbacteria bacterium GWF2_54_11]OGF18139.1 MAG: hypothetical protein A2509_09765 [Candidatus Edwardsbacteria bacterium RIFOXYD1
MNSRGAKMKDYSDFKKNIQQNRDLFTETEKALELFSWSQNKDIIPYLKELYNSLILMETNSKLISNSKCLHFIFPKACLPIDGTNTLNKLYGNTGESRNKFIEVHQFAWDILTEIANPKQYLDNQWNRSETKLVDNAIILLDMQ